MIMMKFWPLPLFAHPPLRWLWLAALVVALDQWTKALVLAYFAPYDTLAVLPHVNLTLRFNTGAAFSLLADAGGWQRWFFVSLALAVSAGILIWLTRLPARGQHWLACALALVLGGAIGNVIDRIVHGHVVDFIELYYGRFYWPAFNVADSAITAGAVMLVLDGLFGSGTDKRDS
ncbi:MAG TPA: signal peptidase II [Gammaproteobacteria bacterium]|nr:signal peptidase II [Gammaproteobacteria bacterium]